MNNDLNRQDNSKNIELTQFKVEFYMIYICLGFLNLTSTKYMALEIGYVAYTHIEYLERLFIKKKSVFLVSTSKSQFSLRQMKESVFIEANERRM